MILHIHTQSRSIKEFTQTAFHLKSEVEMMEFSNQQLPFCEQSISDSYLITARLHQACYLLFLPSAGEKLSREEFKQTLRQHAKRENALLTEKEDARFTIFILQVDNLSRRLCSEFCYFLNDRQAAQCQE